MPSSRKTRERHLAKLAARRAAERRRRQRTRLITIVVALVVAAGGLSFLGFALIHHKAKPLAKPHATPTPSARRWIGTRPVFVK